MTPNDNQNDHQITFLSNYSQNKTNAFRKVSFQKIIDIYNINDKDVFLENLLDLGYLAELNRLNIWAHKSMESGDWKYFQRFPFLFALFLKDIYDPISPNAYNLIDISNASKKPITRTDFTEINGMPDEIFEKLKNQTKKGIYSLKKDLFPSIIFAEYEIDRKGKKIDNIQSHANLFGIDIDLPIASDEEVLELINRHFDVYAVLSSPSQTIRPILRVNAYDDNLKALATWKNIDITGDKFKKQKIALMKEYQALVFEKVHQTLSKEVFKSNGKSELFAMDKACKNANRIWYIGRDPSKKISINHNATPIEITEEDYYAFKAEKKIRHSPKKNSVKSGDKNKKKSLKPHYSEKDVDESSTLIDLYQNELEIINSKILDAIEKIVIICTDNSFQPLFDGSAMYPNCLKLWSSISNVATPKTLEKCFTTLMHLSEEDIRLKGSDYKDRNYENYIIPNFTFNETSQTLYYPYVFNWLKEINGKFDIKVDNPIYYLTEKGKMEIDSFQFNTFLLETYFRLVGSKALYTKDKHLVSLVYSGDTKDNYLFHQHLAKKISVMYPDITEKEQYEISNLAQKKVLKERLLTITNFESIDPKKYIKRDTKDHIHIYTANKKLVITKEKVTALDYSNDDVIIDSYLVKDHNGNLIEYNPDARHEDYKSMPFYQKMAGENYLFSQCIMGYLISTHRSSNANKTIVLFDGIDDVESGGGTGKSLLIRNVEHIRPTLSMVSPKQGDFLFGGLSYQTNVNLDDVSWYHYSIENIKPFTDMRVRKEAKFQNATFTNNHDTPRLCITSNFFPDKTHESFFSRCVFFSPTDFFKRGKNDGYTWLAQLHNDTSGEYKIMEYETPGEWELFLAYNIYCCQLYLRHGIDSFNNLADLKRKSINAQKTDIKYMLMEETMEEFQEEFTILGREIIEISSRDFLGGWNKKLTENKLQSKRRLGSLDQEFAEQIKIEGYTINYYNKSHKCPSGNDFSGFILIKDIEKKLPKATNFFGE